MFDVLVFVYENYWHGDACPELAHLERKLSAVGFDPEEIQDALTWLDELNLAASGLKPALSGQATIDSTPLSDIAAWTPSPHSMRAYSVPEQNHLGADCLGFITFLETSGALPANMRELVLDRAMAAPADPLPLDDLKIIVLMVYWSLGQEPEALVLDELCEDSSQRVTH
jgi:Smg protein